MNFLPYGFKSNVVGTLCGHYLIFPVVSLNVRKLSMTCEKILIRFQLTSFIVLFEFDFELFFEHGDLSLVNIICSLGISNLTF